MRKTAIGTTLLVAVALVAGYAGWQAYHMSQDAVCQVCMRTIHGNRTVAALEGEDEEVFCCPACALTAARQAGRGIRFVSLTDHITQQSLAPEDATLVRNSDVNPCLDSQPHEIVSGEGVETAPLEFDRCAPSILAFSSPQIAQDFIRVHGGELSTVDELTASVR